MKRYVVFAGKDYYANGGAQDFWQDFDTAIAAKEVADVLGGKDEGDFQWSHVFDTETYLIIYQVRRGKVERPEQTLYAVCNGDINRAKE